MALLVTNLDVMILDVLWEVGPHLKTVHDS
jgi:hypothetical protein